METKWKTIEPKIWKPENEQDSIEGILVSKEPKNEQMNYSARYHIKSKEGRYLVWGRKILDERMQYVDIGQAVRITYEGQTQNKRGQDMNLYEVAVADAYEE